MMRTVGRYTDGKVLLVERDPDAIERIVAALASRFDAQITCVSDAELCLDTDMLEPHDVIITQYDLPDTNGLTLAEQLLALRQRPIIMLADNPNVELVLQALRLGVADFFVKPVCCEELLDSVQQSIRAQQLHAQHGTKYRQMRSLVRRVLKERRSINERVELICQDLVSAQRRLTDRVLTVEGRGHRTN